MNNKFPLSQTGPVIDERLNAIPGKAESTTVEAISQDVTAINNAINTVAATGVTASANTSTVNLSVAGLNIKTGDTSSTSVPLPVASSTQAGVMNKATFDAVQDNSDKIEGLLSGAVAISGLPVSPTQSQLTTAWQTATGQTTVINRSIIGDVDNSRIWTYYTNTATWYGVGAAGVTVSLWTNTTAGIAKGSTADGQIFAEDDGTGSVNGWDTLTATVAGKQDTISDLDTIRSNAAAVTDKVTGPAGAVNDRIAVFDGTTGKVIKDSGKTIAVSVPAGAVFTDHITTATPSGTGSVVTNVTADASGNLTVYKGNVDLSGYYTAAQVDALPAVASGITAAKVTSYDTHIVDATIHVTASDKTTWNGKQDAISDLSTIRTGAAAGATAYQLPSGGIPASDLASAVRTSLGLADSAYQKPGTGIPAADIANGVIPDVSNFITASANNLTNYYLKTETYTQAEVNALVGSISGFTYEIYADLSDVTDPSGNVLYLIGPTGAGADQYEEYVYSSGSFVKIGDTSIDLSDYVTTTTFTTALAGKQDTIDAAHKLSYSLLDGAPVISTDIATDATSDTKTASPKAVKTYVDGLVESMTTAEIDTIWNTAMA